jgi:hypothetical protein
MEIGLLIVSKVKGENMKETFKRKIILSMTLIVSLVFMNGCSYYHELAFKGTLLDYDTGLPIEGAIVVAKYKRSSSFLAPHSTSSILDVRETVTNKEGDFVMPSYITLMAPIYQQIPSSLIIFKPGYASLEIRADYLRGGAADLDEEIKKEREGSWWWAKELKYRIHDRGIIELPKVKTKEERKQAWMDADIFGAEIKSSDLPLLNKAIISEKQNSIF